MQPRQYMEGFGVGSNRHDPNPISTIRTQMPPNNRKCNNSNSCFSKIPTPKQRFSTFDQTSLKHLSVGPLLTRPEIRPWQFGLVVNYQPKINFHDQKIYGFEALVRWNHPSKGIVPPGLFIPMAEKTSLISDIGRIVILQTAKQIKEWNKLGFDNICVSVNVVAQQLQRGQLLKDLDEALDRYKISGSSLE